MRNAGKGVHGRRHLTTSQCESGKSNCLAIEKKMSGLRRDEQSLGVAFVPSGVKGWPRWQHEFRLAHGFFGFKSQACETNFKSSPSGENSAICGPRGVWNSMRNKCAPINSRAVPLSIARKCPLIQFQL